MPPQHLEGLWDPCRRLTSAQHNDQGGSTWFSFFGPTLIGILNSFQLIPHASRLSPLPPQTPPSLPSQAPPSLPSQTSPPLLSGPTPSPRYGSPKAPSRFWKIRQRWSRLILICSCRKEGLGCSRDRPQPAETRSPAHPAWGACPHTGSACHILALLREAGNLKTGRKLRKQLVQPYG